MGYGDSSSESEDESVLDDYKGKNGIMFLIDFRQDMFEMDELSEKKYFRLCLNACKNLLLDIAKSGKDDLVGISLIGTERGTSDGTPLLANIQPLESVSADRIKNIDQIIIDEGDSLKDKYGRIDKTSNLNLVKILNSSIKLFLDCKKKIYTKTIVLMTTDDDPFGNDIKSAHLARKQAKKLVYAAIDLIVIGLGETFEPNKFYNELVALASGELTKDWAKVNRVKKLVDIDNHLMSLMSRLSRTNRDLILGEGVAIPVSLYKLFKEPKVKFKRKVVQRLEDVDSSDEEKETSSMNVPGVKTQVSNVMSQGSSFMSSNKETVPLVGGKLINITRAEFEESDFKIEVGIRVIGFMPTIDIPEYLSVKPPRVMLPNYFSVDGLKAFTCLLECCREQNLSIIAWYKYNRYSKLSLVCCLPMSEQSDNEGNVCPDGFCIVTLPFSDNYSDPDVNKLEVEATEKQLNAARGIVKRLTVGFSVDSFHDFELQRTYAMMEALALDYDQVPSVTDDTLLENDSMDSRISNFVEDFMDCSHVGPYDSIAPLKRPATTSYRATKNPKLSSIDGIIDTIKEGKADLLTVAQLKEALSAKGISFSASSKKVQLVQLASLKIK